MLIRIVTGRHTLFAALQMQQALQAQGIAATVSDTVDIADRELHLVYGAQNYYALPRHFIVYQTEVAGSHHFGARYIRHLKKALAVWEYSSANVQAYAHINNNVHIVPPWVGAPQATAAQRHIDVLFYGWLDGSPRRKALLNAINQQLATRNLQPVTVITNTLGPAMWMLLARTKVVLNLHYFEGAPLELFRVTEALSHGCSVVSEVSTGYTAQFKGLSFGQTANQLAEQLQLALRQAPPANTTTPPQGLHAAIAQLPRLLVS